MKIQLNHPGKQKPFKLGKGYRIVGNNTIREWSDDVAHFRKFIQNDGYFINGLYDLKPTKAELYFWGGWEGYSFFNPFAKNDFRKLPNGLHKPFHSTANKGEQNTDPYIFGEEFKYCVCKQKGRLTSLVLDDLILFGTVVPSINKFYIDTVFVVNDHDLSSHVQATSGVDYTQVYQEETLKQLHHYLHHPTFMNDCRIYKGKTWWDDNQYFSFVPCKLSYNNIGFERLYINLDNGTFQLSNYPSGKSFLEKCMLSSKDLWKEIVKISKEQGFMLGIKFEEPTLNNLIQDFHEENN